MKQMNRANIIYLQALFFSVLSNNFFEEESIISWLTLAFPLLILTKSINLLKSSNSEWHVAILNWFLVIAERAIMGVLLKSSSPFLCCYLNFCMVYIYLMNKIYSPKIHLVQAYADLRI